MKALLLSEYKHLEVASVPIPTPGPHDVLVQVAACGICGSDAHGYDGWVGAEYNPRAGTLQGLSWAADWGIGAADKSKPPARKRS